MHRAPTNIPRDCRDTLLRVRLAALIVNPTRTRYGGGRAEALPYILIGLLAQLREVQAGIRQKGIQSKQIISVKCH